ncbi:hypothetical protein CTI12_AA213540 [Artemisia annua]|uniref:Uncharacterized protein n=1 Tax=Artemisia annua TaxID=35608 RepID=A0A2U1NZG7_ARTAN|nr:hypothetical protein CTI12_AA213540 [Artemisia annua]
MRGHYCELDYVKQMPMVIRSMVDSYVTADYWKNKTQERLNKELMDVAEDNAAKRVLREHVRESLGAHNEDILFAAVNKGYTYGSLQANLNHDINLQVVQEGRRECFGRIPSVAMAFQLPTVVNIVALLLMGNINGRHCRNCSEWINRFPASAGKEGMTPHAKNMVKLATHVERRLTMGKRRYERVKEEHHMADRIVGEVLHKTKNCFTDFKILYLLNDFGFL